MVQASAMPGSCEDYAVDVSREVKAMATPAAESTAAAAKSTALRSGIVYRLHLSPQQGFVFVAPPERRRREDGAYAGIARFSVPTAGRWRVNLGSASWIDVVDAGGQRMQAAVSKVAPDARRCANGSSFRSRPGCLTRCN